MNYTLQQLIPTSCINIAIYYLETGQIQYNTETRPRLPDKKTINDRSQAAR